MVDVEQGLRVVIQYTIRTHVYDVSRQAVEYGAIFVYETVTPSRGAPRDVMRTCWCRSGQLVIMVSMCRVWKRCIHRTTMTSNGCHRVL